MTSFLILKIFKTKCSYSCNSFNLLSVYPNWIIVGELITFPVFSKVEVCYCVLPLATKFCWGHYLASVWVTKKNVKFSKHLTISLVTEWKILEIKIVPKVDKNFHEKGGKEALKISIEI